MLLLAVQSLCSWSAAKDKQLTKACSHRMPCSCTLPQLGKAAMQPSAAGSICSQQPIHALTRRPWLPGPQMMMMMMMMRSQAKQTAKLEKGPGERSWDHSKSLTRLIADTAHRQPEPPRCLAESLVPTTTR